MQRREFLAAGGAAIADWGLRIADWSGRTSDAANPQSAIRNPQSRQEPSLGPEVFRRRLDRARAELKARGLRCLIATPSTTHESLTGYNPGRSERLIALILPVDGVPAVVCPSFEVERIKRHGAIADARGWEEQDDPYALVRDSVRRLAPRAGTMALESSTGYQTALRLAAALSGWKFVDAAPVTERLRIVKAPEEVVLIRRDNAGTPRHAVPGDGSRRAPGDHGRGLRGVLHAPPGTRTRHGRARAALSRRGQLARPRARHGVHGRAGDLSAREVRGPDRR